MLEEAGLAKIVLRELGIEKAPQECDLTEWKHMLDRIKNSRKTVKISGRQVRQTARLLSVDRRIPAPCRMGKWRAGGDQRVDSETITRRQHRKSAVQPVSSCRAASSEASGMIAAADYARRNNIPCALASALVCRSRRSHLPEAC